MASANQHYYPDNLNPFGSDDEGESDGPITKALTNSKDEDYPDYLSPFGDEENSGVELAGAADDYDDSLNPFGDGLDDETIEKSIVGESKDKEQDNISDQGEGNPFVGDDDEEEKEEKNRPSSTDLKTTDTENAPSKPTTPQPESLDPPPIPLPRTKSLLKKEQAQRNKQLQLAIDSNNTNSLLSTTSSTSTSSITPTSLCSANNSLPGTFQKKKNKRNAPPVPINFKRQVSGSLDEIKKELNEIGDELAIIEKESNLCQQNLKVTDQVDEKQFAENRSRFIELIKKKNSIVRRQKELMYRKRELKLDQIHSDIEYELRMIGNKQLSHRTPEDDVREKELLKKLVEIVEEKSDIVENLNKDSSCDSHDIGEAFRRLNLSSDPPNEPYSNDITKPSSVLTKNENCDKSSATMGVKLSKIATLLPKGGTLKGTMKIKRKRLFKKV